MKRARTRAPRSLALFLLLTWSLAACMQATPQPATNRAAEPSGSAAVQNPSPTTVAAPTGQPAATTYLPAPTALANGLVAAAHTTSPDASASGPAATAAPTASGALSITATTSASVATPPTTSGSLSDRIIAAQSALMATRAYRGRTVTTLSDGTTLTTTVEFVSPDRFHITAPGGQDFVIIGRNSWQKTPDAGWQKSAIDMSSLVNSFRDPKVLEELAKSIVSSDVRELSDDALNGSPMHVYQYNTAITTGEKTLNGTTKIWIGASDGLPYRMESDQDSLVSAGRTHSVITYDYDSADIKIDAPAAP